MAFNIALVLNIAQFALLAIVIAVVGAKLTRVCETLADQTGLGEAIMGGVFLGAATSIPGAIASTTAAWEGFAELATSNAVGGIAAQTAFLALADMTYRKANLEHSAASLENIIQGAVLIALLAIPLLAVTTSTLSIGRIHPATVVILVVYLFSLRLLAEAKKMPMWKPHPTSETYVDANSQHDLNGKDGQTFLWIKFIILSAILGTAGYLTATTAASLVALTGLSASVVGALFVAVSTSLPELVTTISAVRQGALTLAVGDILGGNSFHVFFLAFSDFPYAERSIY
ncbi:MAG: hypothetical protein KDD53_07530, partial [Bdellovibrionales bacterium]|nr:hypothetical protein [Bdellovibrionales bacterium]